MAAQSGRKLRIKYDADGLGTGSAPVAIAGARTDNLTINNGSIDITDKGDAGVQTLLDDVGVKSVEMTVSGIYKDTTLLVLANSAAAGSALHAFVMDFDGIGEFSGQWFISNFELGGEVVEGVTFSCTFQSSGAITWTAD